MTVLSAIQEATKRLGLAVPTAVFGSGVRQHVELAGVAQAALADIRSDAEWEKLKTVATITGDGSTTAFDLEADYDRMPAAADLHSTALQRKYNRITDEDWLTAEVRSYALIWGHWTMFGGQIHFKPAPALNELVKYFYLSRNAVRPASGADKATFTADTDVIRVGDDELLKRAIIWRWRENKGIPYAQDLDDYENWRDHLVGHDAGAKVLTVGRRSAPRGARTAWPGVIVP